MPTICRQIRCLDSTKCISTNQMAVNFSVSVFQKYSIRHLGFKSRGTKLFYQWYRRPKTSRRNLFVIEHIFEVFPTIANAEFLLSQNELKETFVLKKTYITKNRSTSEVVLSFFVYFRSFQGKLSFKFSRFQMFFSKL